MKVTTVLLALAFSALLQRTPSPQELLRLERPLATAEMETVVNGIRQALAGKTLRLVDQRTGESEILMGPNGAPDMIRYKGLGERIAGVTGAGGTMRVFNVPDVIVWQFEYSRGPARRCSNPDRRCTQARWRAQRAGGRLSVTDR
jgi:hypothetical protein